MLYTIENDLIRVEIDSLGGEMMSVKTKADDTEYLWQGDPAYWKGRAFHLFPICGRLYGGEYTYKGKNYPMNIHGFLRASDLTVTEQARDTITFLCTDSEESRRQYPFAFRFYLTYRLVDQTVEIDFAVENTDGKPLIFTLGGHPGFGLPLQDGLAFEDYTVEFAARSPEKLLFSPTCFLTGETEPFALENGRLAMRHDLFDQDAIFLQNMGDWVTLRSDKGTKGVTVRCPDMKYLGLWHKPLSDAPYVCLEPWLGIPSYEGKIDDLETKRDMIHLPAGETFRSGFSITLF
ncbi:MAG: aldose 1-epimerase family protein [Clostridia bacterium]|nr:aldose 1-epimerase family protein [Clostridia bacterium]